LQRIQLKAADLTIVSELLENDFYISQSTDKKLGRLRVQFEANDGQTRAAEDFINTKQTVETNSGTDTATRWRIGNHSNSYSNNSPRTTFTWELLQVEDLTIDKLLIEGWELNPYKYSEEFEGKGVLTIHARVELLNDEQERLRKLPLYFQVVRRGINDTGREMRLGQLLWSKKEPEDKYRMSLILVDRAYDSSGLKHGMFEPRFGNVAENAALVRLRLAALLDKLVEKGVLSGDEVKAIRVVDDERLNTELREIDRVNDLDEWLSDED
jgi:hypothetical protein